MNRSDLGDLSYFLAIARHGNFRKAGIELGVTASALSHAMKAFENRLGVRLLNRTARSVTPTAAGDALARGSNDALTAIGEAFESLNRFRDRPGGKIRINVVVDAAALLFGPILAQMGERYPEIEVDIVASNRMVDVVAEGFDAGVRYGGTVPKDMIAQRLTPDLRWIVVASPSYLERYGTPSHPSDLQYHRCLGVRLGDDRVYDWEFSGPEGEFSVAVESAIVANDSRATLAVALQDGGLTFGLEPVFAPYLNDGTLMQVLGDFAISGPGFHLYYSSRRQLPAGLKAFVELARELKPLG